MAVKRTGISAELIIHPGEILGDVLSERGMLQKELADKTGISPAYVSDVINGKKGISTNFAVKLESALDVPCSFWINLQANYEAQLAQEDQNNSTETDCVCSAMEVAQWFLYQQSMTHKKLQKLCYYAQAWYCALYSGSPLFKEEIQAWVHGPVIPVIYPVFAQCGWQLIQQSTVKPHLPQKAENVLKYVFDKYGDMEGDQLEALTHSELPWQEARGDISPASRCITPISCASMRKFYLGEYEKQQND